MFKRILLMLLAIIMAVSVYGCSGDESTDSTAEESSTDSVAAENGASLPMLSLSVPPTSYAESGIELPDTIDSTYINNIKTKLDNAPYACAMYYVDLETGLSLTYNPDRMFAGASLVKAEYLMMIFEMIENGELSYEDLYTYTSANKRGGTTKIPQDFKDGDKLTLKQIIEYVVWHSDK